MKIEHFSCNSDDFNKTYETILETLIKKCDRSYYIHIEDVKHDGMNHYIHYTINYCG